MKKAIIKGMCCEGCARDVKHVLESIYGITNVKVSCEDGTALFDGFVSKKIIEEALRKEGYQLTEISNV
ncbi:MAG: heavy-metal-associated domain-containing protein [Bacilli bacterium]|nr:heavy-metal-associated domain-containing protein [Bacilli bacterium]MBN2696365.1 heavy-metal-associated domain-containing protein [Bacilli bacterium]